MPTIQPGTILHGRYRVRRQIGAGGMGAVYEATDNRLHNTVALKRMTASGFDRAFEQEAQFLAALRHAGLPVVTDYFTEDGNLYLAMQYIEGEDLAHVLKNRQGRCEEADVVSWALAILDVLIYLHDHQPPIVHRDIKPANIKLTPRGDVVLLDFGLAKGSLADGRTQLENERSLYGFTPGYAPLEQIDGRGTDPRSDVYALGATLFQLITGVTPFSAQARAAAVGAGHLDPLLPASSLNKRISQTFSDVLARALELDPSRRFASAREMRAALISHPESGKSVRNTGEISSARRVDAAMASQAEVGRQIDLIVQVRFADSPLLGLEDWPTKRRPASIEQGSEPLHLKYPVDPKTGNQLPTRVRIKLVAPDFVIEGPAEHLVEVRPDEYSKRIAFLLTPSRAGLCRVNVEVYAVDALYLGTIPVEAEAFAAAVAHPVLRVANLVLRLFTREASHEAWHSNRGVDLVVEDGARAFEGEPLGAAAAHDTVHVGAPGAPPPAIAIPSVSRREREVLEPVASEAPAPARMQGWLRVAAPMVLLLAVIGIAYQGVRPAAPPSGSSADPIPGPIASPDPPASPPRSPSAAPPSPQPAAPPFPEPAAPSIGPSSPLGRVTSSDQNVAMELATLERVRKGTVRANLTFVNRNANAALLVVDNARTRFRTRGGSYPVTADAAATGADGSFTLTLRPLVSAPHWIEFAVPETAVGPFELLLSTKAGSIRFPPLTFTLVR